MIPASYLFKEIYRNNWLEDDTPAQPVSHLPNGHVRIALKWLAAALKRQHPSYAQLSGRHV